MYPFEVSKQATCPTPTLYLSCHIWKGRWENLNKFKRITMNFEKQLIY
jgi:hypothetical protein